MKEDVTNMKRRIKVYVLSQGGLGNQLFQAQYAHTLSLRNPQISVFFVNANSIKDRDFQLAGFFLPCPHLSEISKYARIVTFLIRVNKGFLRRFHFDLFKIFRITYISEFDAFDGTFPIDNVYQFVEGLGIFSGHFQNLTYFDKNSLCFNDCLTQKIWRESTGKNLSQILRYSVVIHARFGDYLSNPSHGPIDATYYSNFVSELHLNSNLMIHSDGPEHLIEHFRHFPWNNISKNPWDLLRDAMETDYFIGSNSTLSWWAAYCRNFLTSGNSDNTYLPEMWMRGIKTADLNLLFPDWHTRPVSWVD
jgi:hypothetical protein